MIETVEALATAPEQARMDAEGYRFRNRRGFPFVMAYRLIEGSLVVLAIAHHRRSPGLWRDRETNE